MVVQQQQQVLQQQWQEAALQQMRFLAAVQQHHHQPQLLQNAQRQQLLAQQQAAEDDDELTSERWRKTGPHRILNGWLELMRCVVYNAAWGVDVLVHLAHVAIATRRPVLLQHVLFLFKQHGVRFDAERAFLQLAQLERRAESVRHGPAPPGELCAFPSYIDGWDLADCPVLYVAVRFGRLRLCDANDVFQQNVLDRLEDGENFFDVCEQLIDEDDLPSCYDALTELLSGISAEAFVTVKLHEDIDTSSGWLKHAPRPLVATVRFRFELTADGREAKYGVCVMPPAPKAS